MTLEDDVESMLSDQFNTSNESMFKVRGVTASGQTQLGGGLAGGGGDSTFRCNDSIQDEDRGLISESEDGWYPERDNQKNQDQGQHDNFDDISEHSSDEMTDSDNPEIIGDAIVKKIKKKGEKGERKKKKKKKADQQLQSQNQNDLQGHDLQDSNAQTGEPKKLVQTYKKLEDSTRDGGSKKVGKQDAKADQKQANADNSKKNQRKKDMNTTQIKVNLERKNKGGEKTTTNNNNNGANDAGQNKNQYQSPNVKGKNEKQQSMQSKSNTVNKKEANAKNEKKDDKELAKQLALDIQKSSANQPAAATPLKKPKKNGLKL